MNIKDYLIDIKEKYAKLINYLENQNSSPPNFKEFLPNIQHHDINGLKEYLLLISSISNNYQRSTSFFHKIEQILIHLKDDINHLLTNKEIFDIFKNNKRALLFLFREKIVIIDKYISKVLTNEQFTKKGYHMYFSNELNEFFSTKKSDQISENLKDIEIKRSIGENDSKLCEIIRNDSLDEFISFIKDSKKSFSQKIEPSIYETNPLLIEKRPTLIKYAAFFGSFKIFQYLSENGIECKQSLWKYSIHSKNYEIMNILQQKFIIVNKKSFNESIKCHHNDITNFLIEKISFNFENDSEILSNFVKYRNYSGFPNNIEDEYYFFNFCKYDYISMVELFLKTSNVDVNKKIEIIKHKKKVSFEKSENSFFIACKKGNKEIVKLLLNYRNIELNVSSNLKHFYYYKEEIYEKNALLISVEEENTEIVKLLLAQKDINVNINSVYQYVKKNGKTNYIGTEVKPLLHIAVEKQNQEIIQLLLSCKNIDVNQKFKCYEESPSKYRLEKTVLYLTAEKENLEIMKLLLTNQNIDVNDITIRSYFSPQAQYKNEKTVLHFAVSKRKNDLLKLLLDNPKIDVNIKHIKEFIRSDEDEEEKIENNALSIAIDKEYNEIVECLLTSTNIDVNNPSIFSLGQKKESESFLSFIISFKEKVKKKEVKTPLYSAILKDNLKIVDILLANEKIDVNKKSHIYIYGSKSEEKIEEILPLHAAIQKKNIDIIKILLLHKDIDINIKSINTKNLDMKDEAELYMKTFIKVAAEHEKKKKAKIKEVKNIEESENYSDYHSSEESSDSNSEYDEYDEYDEYEEEENAKVKREFDQMSEEDQLKFKKHKEQLKNEEENKEIKYGITKEENAFQIAIEEENEEIIKLLLSQPNLDLNAKLFSIEKESLEKKIEKTVFHTAIKNGKLSIIKLLLSIQQIDVNAKYCSSMIGKEISANNEEKTAIHIAIENNEIDIVKLLLKRNDIDINIKSLFYVKGSYEEENITEEQTLKKTPLHVAIEEGNSEIVRLLLTKPEIDVNAILDNTSSRFQQVIANLGVGFNRKEDKTPILIAIEQKNLNIFNILINNQNIDMTKKLLIDYESIELIKSHKIKVEKNLLHVAIEENMIDIVKILLEYKIFDINEKSIYDGKGKTPLFIAIEKQNLDIVKLLLSQENIDINIKSQLVDDDNEITPIYYAIYNENIEIVKLLILREDVKINEMLFISKNVNTENEYIKETQHKNALHLAIEKGNLDIINLLLSNKDTNPNIKLICMGKIVKEVDDIGTVEIQMRYQKTPLFLAIEGNNIEIFKSLLARPNINVNEWSVISYGGYIKSDNPMTPLHYAVKQKKIEVIKMLLNHENINLDTRDDKNRKPIDYVEDEEIRKLFDEKMKSTHKNLMTSFLC